VVPSRRARALVVACAAVGALVSGCGSSTSTRDASSQASASPSHRAGTQMKDMDMSSSAKPTGTATMVCREDEIRDAVRRTFSLTSQPRGTEKWVAKDRLFSCTYTLPGGPLVLTVQDATDARAGHAYFERLRTQVHGARRISGMENFGFPAYQTQAGDVLFLKDGKTLHVDATGLSVASLPAGYDRADAAYSIASAVIGCWTE
jgi:uncharacterized protein YceK